MGGNTHCATCGVDLSTVSRHHGRCMRCHKRNKRLNRHAKLGEPNNIQPSKASRYFSEREVFEQELAMRCVGFTFHSDHEWLDFLDNEWAQHEAKKLVDTTVETC